MDFKLLDFSFLSVIFKIILIILIYVIIVQALKIMSKDVKRGGARAGRNLGWKLKAEIIGDEGDFAVGDVILIGDKISIGRNKANQLVMPSQSVSNFHAQIYFEDGRYMLEDLKSTNGTFVNGVKIEKRNLQPGDEIRISQTIFKVLDD